MRVLIQKETPKIDQYDLDLTQYIYMSSQYALSQFRQKEYQKLDFLAFVRTN